MKDIIIIENRYHLSEMIDSEIALHGFKCSLNHFDVSRVTDMGDLFNDSAFNGNISKWDTFNVTNMNSMFACSCFNGNISKWNTSQVNDMFQMFYSSAFTKDISKWDVSQVEDMGMMFYSSAFTRDLSCWRPLSLESSGDMFNDCKAPIPYWHHYDNAADRKGIIGTYVLYENMKTALPTYSTSTKRLKV